MFSRTYLCNSQSLPYIVKILLAFLAMKLFPGTLLPFIMLTQWASWHQSAGPEVISQYKQVLWQLAQEGCGSWRRNMVWKREARSRSVGGKCSNQQTYKIENGGFSSHWCLVRISLLIGIHSWYGIQLQMEHTFFWR